MDPWLQDLSLVSFYWNNRISGYNDMSLVLLLFYTSVSKYHSGKATTTVALLTFKRRIKTHLLFAGIIRSSPYSPRFQDNG